MVAGSEFFVDEIAAFQDRPGITGKVLLYGSSTIRLWETFQEDLPGALVENRGFGGSTLKACAQAWESIGRPLRPSALVVYAGDNDLDQGASPEEVLESFRILLGAVRAKSAKRIPVCLVSIKPSPSRWGIGDRIRGTNRLLEEECQSHGGVWFLDIATCFLDGDLRPRVSAFQPDGLHLSRKGYRILGEAVARWLALLGRWNGDLVRRLETTPQTPLLPQTLRFHRGLHLGETDSDIQREYHAWHSKSLGRNMEILVFGHAGERVLVFPSRMERFYEWENRGMVHACARRIEAGELQLICLDGIDNESFFAFDKSPGERIARHYSYERYVIEEVLPFSEARNPDTALGATGCSLGAFHAAAIFFRHPDKFRRLLALSGRFDLSREFGPDYPDLFLGYREEPLYFLMPPHFLPSLRDSAALNALRESEIVFAVGETDGFRPSNDDLSHILWQLGIPHFLRPWVGEAHRFRHWRQMARIYLG